jgi:hypothetical protein
MRVTSYYCGFIGEYAADDYIIYAQQLNAIWYKSYVSDDFLDAKVVARHISDDGVETWRVISTNPDTITETIIGNLVQRSPAMSDCSEELNDLMIQDAWDPDFGVIRPDQIVLMNSDESSDEVCHSPDYESLFFLYKTVDNVEDDMLTVEKNEMVELPDLYNDPISEILYVVDILA